VRLKRSRCVRVTSQAPAMTKLCCLLSVLFLWLNRSFKSNAGSQNKHGNPVLHLLCLLNHQLEGKEGSGGVEC